MSANDGPVLLSSDDGGVRTLTLNRPDRKNAINPQLWVELADALRAAARDDLRALVITGAGGAFCSGANISTTEDIHPRQKLRRLTDVALALHDLTVPTIAKVTGVAVGAGWNLALGCDFVVATPESRFCQVFSKRGLSVDLGSGHLGEVGRRDRRVRLRSGRATRGRPTRRTGAEQGAAQRRCERDPTRGVGQRGPRAAGKLRHRRLNRGVRGVRPEARTRVHWSMGSTTQIGVAKCVKP
jgi:enoyl-CoA hydratase/carnithine racemase